MSIWFFCHLGLDDGSTNLKTRKQKHRITLTHSQDAGVQVQHPRDPFILFLVFIHLQVEDLLQGHINLFDTEQDQSVEHCRRNKTKRFVQMNKAYNAELYFHFQCKSLILKDLPATNMISYLNCQQLCIYTDCLLHPWLWPQRP